MVHMVQLTYIWNVLFYDKGNRKVILWTAFEQSHFILMQFGLLNDSINYISLQHAFPIQAELKSFLDFCSTKAFNIIYTF